MQPRNEQRLTPRAPAQAKVWVRWADQNGVRQGGRVRALDASDRGIRVLLEQRVDPFSYVHVECHELKLTGIAVVRHCTRQGMGWAAGLQVGSRSCGRD